MTSSNAEASFSYSKKGHNIKQKHLTFKEAKYFMRIN